MSCPNISSPQWRALVDRIGVREAYREWARHKGEIPDAEAYAESFMGVNATLKVIGALSTPKMDQVYTKFFSSNKDKFYAELLNNGATKEQVQLLKDWNEKNPTTNLADMLAGIASEMSYTIEVNEATESRYSNDPDDYDYNEESQELQGGNFPSFTSYYSSMTVEGGTNYRENEIRTPNITPVRKGHAQFSTDQGIGWFRSDDQRVDDNKGKKVSDGAGGLVQLGVVSGSTRRILEVQSDLFQKGRELQDLALGSPASNIYRDNLDNGFITQEKYDELMEKDETPSQLKSRNSFLQLLNKDNNWVTFFVKSIIQDSTRKGYGNVLFPSGSTAAKVEGHETLEQFLANTQSNIDDLSRRLEPGGLDNWFNAQVQGIQSAATSNKQYAEFGLIPLDPSHEYTISKKTIDSKYEFSRVRQNYYNRESRYGDKNATLTGDNYDGWVLYQYTVGKGNSITKLTNEEAQALVKKENDPYREESTRLYKEQQANVDNMLANKEGVLQKERPNIQREVDHLRQEMEDARAGRTQLSSIASFYENTIQNILNKQKFSPERITDEYGNEWFKVKLKDDYKDTIYFNKQESSASFEKRSAEFLQKEGLITQDKQKGWVVVSRVNNNDGRIVSVRANNWNKLLQIRNNYYDKFGVSPYNVYADGSIVFNGDATVFIGDNKAIEAARSKTMEILDLLSKKTGMSYEIINSDKAETLLGTSYDTAIKGFYNGGKVYLIEGNITPDLAFHEFAHPFVTALRLANPTLFNRIVDDLNTSVEGTQLWDSIQKTYLANYTTQGISKDEHLALLAEEVVVRAMTNVAEGNLSFESPQGKGFWSKLWFGIKQFFRKVFGQNIDLSKLDEKTTLSDLSRMLLGDKVIQYPKDEEDYALFNRDIAKEMESIPEHNAMKGIEVFHRIAQDHLVKLRENKNYIELREVLKNQADGSILNDINKLLALSKEKEAELDNNFKKLNNFARAVVGARILSEKMKEHVVEMSNKEMDERDKLRAMRYYSFMSNDWLQAFEQLREINQGDLPLLGDEIGRATNNFKRINDHIAQAFKGGLVSTLRDQLQQVNDNVKKELGPELEKVKKEVENGNTKLKDRLVYLQKMYDHGTFDDEKILKLLQGELGDTNWFSSMLESYTSSPDPIVGGFASYINKELYKVESGVQEFSTMLGNELAPLYKQYGVDVSRPEDLGKQLVFKDIAFTKDDEGKPKGHEVHTFLHEFSNGYQYDYQLLQHQIDEAKEAGNKEKVIELQQQFNQLRKDYFHREYVDEVYNAKEFWNESDINRLAQARRKEITDQLASYEAESGFKDLEKEDRDHIDELLIQLKTLASTKNLDGTDKEGDDLGVAQAIKEYNSRMMKFREEMAMKGAFERDLQTQKDDLLDKGFTEDSPEYNSGLNNWLKENLRVRLSDQFYDSRNKITDEIAQIVNKLPQDEAKKLDVSLAWKEMFEQIKGLRDQDNQPIGTNLTEDKIKAVKSLQENIDRMVENLRRKNGLTSEEQSRYSELWGKIKAGIPLDEGDQADWNDIADKKKLGLSAVDNARLTSLFEELKEFQSKIPTEYYLQALDQKLKEGGITGEANMQIADQLQYAELADPLLDSIPDNPFTKWFLANHIKKVKWDPDSQQNREMYERLYIWNRIVPNDETFKNALATNNYQALLANKNPLVEVRPAAKYFFYRIKNEYRTKREIGKTVDNRGNWLPRTIEQGAKDSKYINKQYADLKNSKDTKQKALYGILETYKKYHLKVQEDSPKYGRLWYELPRVRKERIENLEALATRPVSAAKNMISWVASKLSIRPKADAFDQDLVRKRDLQDERKLYVATDLFGNEINSIPMKYMSKLDADDVSMDIGRSVLKYTQGLMINKTLHDVNPFAQALKQTLSQEGIKSINKVSTRNWSSKFMNIPVLNRDNERLKTITNMVERDIEGVENKMELGLFGSKVAQHIMSISAFGSLALNLPAGIKNIVVAKLQNLSESNSKEFLGGPKTLAKADGIFFKRFMPKLVHDYNSFSNRSLETQMFELFDFVQGKFGEHVGESFSASYKKDIARLRFTHSFQALGELQAQGQAGIAMMLTQQVPWTHNGTTTMIPYLDAWELKNGVIQIKDGIDARWSKSGDEFAGFKLRMHKINELMQGAYAKMNQPEATRYTAFKMFNFMRRYLTPGIVNRFTVNRNNVALGTQREGFYFTTARLGLDMVKNGLDNWHSYSDKEKRNVYKTLTEMGYSISFLVLMGLMGYNDNDPDKNKKLKDNSWAHNMALYELAMIKGEVENFIPIPGMGINEILRMKDQPSIAFPLLNKYYKILHNLIDLVHQPFSDYDLIHYKKSTGIYKKGDLKIVADILKAIGYSGATLHPDVALKNYMATTNRYD